MKSTRTCSGLSTRPPNPGGIKVSAVEVKNVDLPQEMQRAIARQAEAERERRSKVIHAEGEFQASQRLSDVANILSRNPAALQLRYLETIMNVAGDKNSTILFPVPIDLLSPFLKHMESSGALPPKQVKPEPSDE